jgi:hypothetical protein
LRSGVSSLIDCEFLVKVGVIQSSFIPWRGYFDFIASVDVFVFLDDTQYSKNSWRNRNQIKTPGGLQWLTVPVRQERLEQLISETRIDYSVPWLRKHLGVWQANYARTPYFDVIMEILSGLNGDKEETISQLNVRLTRRICEYLQIDTPMMLSSELALAGSKTDRLIDLLKKLNATAYLSGPSADAYLDKEAFRRHGIGLEYKSYDYEPYPQLWGPFEGAVTVLDLIANCGPQARNLIRNKSPDVLVIAQPVSSPE